MSLIDTNGIMSDPNVGYGAAFTPSGAAQKDPFPLRFLHSNQGRSMLFTRVFCLDVVLTLLEASS